MPSGFKRFAHLNFINHFPFYKKGPVLVILVPGEAIVITEADEANEVEEVLRPRKSLLRTS